jgi:hypothetical protein
MAASSTYSALLAAVLSAAALFAPSAIAQGNPAWIDPPAVLSPEAPQAKTPPHPPVEPSTGSPEAGEAPRQTSALPAGNRRELAVRDFAFEYLEQWSAPNDRMLATAASFYGPRIGFHGRNRSLASVLAEKRRFAERWPERYYRYRPGTSRVTCEPGGGECTFRSVFDYAASNPVTGKLSRGSGEHVLVVSLAGERPVILSESSRPLRGR